MNAPRPLAFLLALLALLPLFGSADAGRRSGGGFGGVSRGYSRSYSTPRSSPYRSTPRSSPYAGNTGSGTTASALNRWRSLTLPAGVSRTALTYSPSYSSAYPYGFGGRYYPYPQSYYQQHGLGSLLGSAVLAGVAGSVVTSALNQGTLGQGPVIQAPFAPERSGFSGWTLLLLAGAGYLVYRLVRRR